MPKTTAVLFAIALSMTVAQAAMKKTTPPHNDARTQTCGAKCAAYNRRVVAEDAEMDEAWTPAESAQAVKACIAACQKGWNPPPG